MTRLTLGDLVQALLDIDALGELHRPILVKDFDRPYAWQPEGVAIDNDSGAIVIYGSMADAPAFPPKED